MPSHASACGSSERLTTSAAATTANVRIGSVTRGAQRCPTPSAAPSTTESQMAARAGCTATYECNSDAIASEMCHARPAGAQTLQPCAQASVHPLQEGQRPTNWTSAERSDLLQRVFFFVVTTSASGKQETMPQSSQTK